MTSRRRLACELMEILETGIVDMLRKEAPHLLGLVLEAVNETGTMAFLVGEQWWEVEELVTEKLESHFPEKQYVSVHQDGIIHGVKLFHDEADAYQYNKELIAGFDDGRWKDVREYNCESSGTLIVMEVKVNVRDKNPEDDT